MAVACTCTKMTWISWTAPQQSSRTISRLTHSILHCTSECAVKHSDVRNGCSGYHLPLERLAEHRHANLSVTLRAISLLLHAQGLRMILQIMHLTLKKPSKFHFAKFSDNIIKTPITMEEQVSNSSVSKNTSLADNAHHHRCECAGGRTWACAVRSITALGNFVGCGQDLQKVSDTINSSSLPRAVSFLRRQQCTSRRSFCTADIIRTRDDDNASARTV